MTIKDLKHPGLFAAGVLFGTAGIKALSSKDAKNFTPTAPQLFFVQESCYGYGNDHPGECGGHLC